MRIAKETKIALAFFAAAVCMFSAARTRNAPPPDLRDAVADTGRFDTSIPDIESGKASIPAAAAPAGQDVQVGADDQDVPDDQDGPDDQEITPEQQSKTWDEYIQKLGPLVKGDNLYDAGTNKLELLIDGDELMKSIAPDIKNAKKFIHFEMYQWQPNGIGEQFRDLLSERAKAGVDVRVILDGYGSSMGGNSATTERKFLDSMIKAGINVKVRKFKLLHLDHRKVMVMDSGSTLVAYTGGMNIGDDYQLNWHDQQTRITGPATWRLHRSFVDDWKQITGEDVADSPAAASVAGGARVHVITHIGGLRDQNIKRAYLLAINTARQLIRIEDPYFTNQRIINALIRAAKKGVKVQLIVPLKDDMIATLRSFRCRYPRLLKAGVEIYEYQPRMEHMKVAVMDHLWATVGSSNLDPQSLKFNNELNLIVLDKNFAAEMDTRIFEADIALSERITSHRRKLNEVLPRWRPFN